MGAGFKSLMESKTSQILISSLSDSFQKISSRKTAKSDFKGKVKLEFIDPKDDEEEGDYDEIRRLIQTEYACLGDGACRIHGYEFGGFAFSSQAKIRGRGNSGLSE